METSEPLPESRLDGSILSQEDSHARISAWPEDGPELTEKDLGYGLNSHESLGSFDRGSYSLKTCQVSLLTNQCDEYSETFPASGFMLNGRVFPRPPLVPRTSDSESLFWPTPNLPNGGRSIPESARWSGMVAYKSDGKKLQVGLESAVRRWPTPKASPSGPDYARMNREGSGGDDLAPAVARENFHTPTAAPFSHGGSGGELHKQVAPGGGPLSPRWVEWLMGFPIGWTDLADSETPSCHKSPNGSDAE